ncbi:hypothetical protein L228DRAFT_268237 [Xylona heveae TC161]|uniref:Uncharacterized protein n=1 Tax=Xylona heveae (strain CBS 132557 / TC161) TaxID=1328760 RepID=A0A165H185_XYLHT|nr:hypothetical protein L228DRAFT_268237 [Xylona heveae TC161]KZF22856.1 hypothetical protein L228DRAFT_268237 [Xylona heveae TC161]
MSQPLGEISSSDLNLRSPAIKERFSDAGQDDLVNLGHEENHNHGVYDMPFNDDISDVPASSPFDMYPSKPSSPLKPIPTARRNSPAKQTHSPAVAESARNDEFNDVDDLDVDLETPIKNSGPTSSANSIDIHLDEEDHDASAIDYEFSEIGATPLARPIENKQEDVSMDDTCFSDFSAIPNADMTLFARVGQQADKESMTSPTKFSTAGSSFSPTPRRRRGLTTPGSFRQQSSIDDLSPRTPSPSPTPRRIQSSAKEQTTYLLDFTEQINSFSSAYHNSPSRHATMSPSKPQPELASYMASMRTPSPAKQRLPPATPSEQRKLMNLLDFDIPPAPTPRSIPSITARELETVKSNFQSQISSMRATLSGREAEVNSLKEAIADAERRVGENMEAVREERATRESLEMEKAEWEKRGNDLETLLRNAREDFFQGEQERERLAQRLEQSERKREEAEARATEAESKVAGLEAGAASATSQSDEATPGTPKSNKDVETAVEKVARDLHALYKSKHETKVAALRKSYESRWDKRVRELEEQIASLDQENTHLRNNINSNDDVEMSEPRETESSELDRQQLAQALHRAQEQEHRIASLIEDLNTSKREHAQLMSELHQERLEKGDLVAAVEEMLNIQAMAATTNGSTTEPPTPGTSRSTSASSNPFSASINAATGLENLRSSISRVSGLKTPGFGASMMGSGGESRIGRLGSGVSSGSAASSGSGSGLNSGSSASGSGLGLGGYGRSGIMSNIERMGRRGA